MHNSRALAATIMTKIIIEGKSLSDLTLEIKNHKESSFIQAVCYGVCRYYFQLDFIANQLISKPLKAKDFNIHALILIGIFQLQYMRVPAHAAISETVNASLALEKSWAKNFVNAILRQFQRQQHELIEKSKSSPAIYYSHPEWFVNLIKKAYPENFLTILENNNQQAPLVLRINQQKISRENYLKKLAELNIQAEFHPLAKEGIILQEACDVKSLPEFTEGEFSVQDGAAQLAAHLLQIENGQRILDACAAPGGKTTHMLEIAANNHLLAIDHEAARVARIKENLQRLQLHAHVQCADVLQIDAWWDKQLFDRILLDAPCSATGVIRRHPDIKLLRRENDIAALAKTQLLMLKTLWPLLKPNGLLLYATCSVLPAENSTVIAEFLKLEHTAQEIIIKTEWGIKQPYGRQILPGHHTMDGFYYCLLQKI